MKRLYKNFYIRVIFVTIAVAALMSISFGTVDLTR